MILLWSPFTRYTSASGLVTVITVLCVCVFEDSGGGKEENGRVLVSCIVSYAKIECCLVLFLFTLCVWMIHSLYM